MRCWRLFGKHLGDVGIGGGGDRQRRAWGRRALPARRGACVQTRSQRKRPTPRVAQGNPSPDTFCSHNRTLPAHTFKAKPIVSCLFSFCRRRCYRANGEGWKKGTNGRPDTAAGAKERPRDATMTAQTTYGADRGDGQQAIRRAPSGKQRRSFLFFALDASTSNEPARPRHAFGCR